MESLVIPNQIFILIASELEKEMQDQFDWGITK